MRSPALNRDTQGRLLAAVFSAVIGSFLVSTILVQRASADVDAFADSLISNSMPSIDRLALIRADVLEVELALSRYIQLEWRGDPIRLALDAALLKLDGHV